MGFFNKNSEVAAAELKNTKGLETKKDAYYGNWKILFTEKSVVILMLLYVPTSILVANGVLKIFVERHFRRAAAPIASNFVYR